ncbi:uncharacterized protein APUU_10631A [Aspergillus puulaauensis]|uniref:Uncharacterized protein n=1 Tax=Aspergillus puulaauensis TaxID=1220207 RepID=A0A7R7XAM3_9EURO|nr:uncharacterized protein APUU_10631A [Aspergillus puulaauensis]BCS17803.1 hypothetical protein APUU_10631A [Aspergillus puulaauensis]
MFGVELVIHIDGSSYLAWVVLGVVTLTAGPLLVVSILWTDAVLLGANTNTVKTRERTLPETDTLTTARPLPPLPSPSNYHLSHAGIFHTKQTFQTKCRSRYAMK